MPQQTVGRSVLYLIPLALAASGCTAPVADLAARQEAGRQTSVTIDGEMFLINGRPTYEGRTWSTSQGEHRVEGLLMNARLVQGIFDDLNPATRGQWGYPDTGVWDPDRNTREFIEAMPAWREHGLLSFTINLQGGCPYGYCRAQPWDNSAFDGNGELRPAFMARLERVLDRADELGMVPIVGYFYFGQDDRLVDESAVVRAVENATTWILEKGYQNVIVELNNECNVSYDHEILQCGRVHELIELARGIERDGRSLYVGTSLGGGAVPPASIVTASDFVLLHGNGVRDPARMTAMIEEVRGMDAYTPKPIINNEDDQPWRVEEQDWGEGSNNFAAAVRGYASWGYFDFRREEEHDDPNLGYQSVPVNWHVSADRKRDFLDMLAEVAGSPGTPELVVEWSREIGGATVDVEGERSDAPIREVSLLVDNTVVATSDRAPHEFRIDPPRANHWVRARAVYLSDGEEVIVESPMYRNPWWPYGGPPRE